MDWREERKPSKPCLLFVFRIRRPTPPVRGRCRIATEGVGIPRVASRRGVIALSPKTAPPTGGAVFSANPRCKAAQAARRNLLYHDCVGPDDLIGPWATARSTVSVRQQSCQQLRSPYKVCSICTANAGGIPPPSPNFLQSCTKTCNFSPDPPYYEGQTRP